jgi:hypothetical protein
VYERTCSGAQHHDLTIQLRLLGDRAQQVIVLDLPTAICVGARQYPIGYESVGFGLKTHGHFDPRFGLIHKTRVFIRMYVHASPPQMRKRSLDLMSSVSACV